MFGSAHPRARFMAAVVVGLVLIPSLALADNATADGDAGVSGVQSLDLGSRCVGSTTVATFGVYVTRQGNNTSQNFKNGSTANVAMTDMPAGVTTGAAPIGQITFPSTWEGSRQGTLSPTTTVTVTFKPTTVSSFSQAPTLTVNGITPAGAAVTRPVPDSFKISGAGVACDTTAPAITPVVTGTLGNNGWYTSDVDVSFTVSDPQSAISSSTGCGATLLTTDTAGITYTCTATSGGGTSSNSVTVKRDATAPTGIAVSARTTDANGWYNAPFTATWSGTDAPSGIASCTSTPYSGPDNGAGSLSGTCTDDAGNVSGAIAFPFKYDSTGPIVTGTLSRAADSNGWYNAPVTVTWTAESLSGAVCTAPQTYSGPDDGAAVLSGSCTSSSGLIGDGTKGLQYDATAPVVTVSADRDPDSNGWYNGAFTLTTNGTDGASGIASCSEVQPYSGPDTGAGSLGGSCTDIAGNTASSAPFSFRYDATAPSATIALDRSPDAGGWYNAAVIGTTTGSDSLSGIGSCTAAQTYSGPDGSNLSLSGTCSDLAGNTSLPDSVVFSYDATAPVADVAADRDSDHNGWYTDTFTLSTSGTDATSGIASCSADQPYSGPDTTAGSLSGTCTDVAGNAHSASFGFQYDGTAPTVAVTLDRLADHNGWYTASVDALTTGIDGTSGIDTCTALQTYNGPDGAALSLSGSCTDLAGNSNSGSVNFKYDATNPVIAFTGAAPAANDNGWNNTNVSLGWACSDATSGVAASTLSQSVTTEGANQSRTGVCTDGAGNTASDARSVSIDKTLPTLAVTAPAGTYVLNQSVTPTVTCADSLSGVAACTHGASVSTASVGSGLTFPTSATDKAGNGASASGIYSVRYATGMCEDSLGRTIRQPINVDGTSVFKQGSTVPAKFRVCDANGVSIGTAGVVTSFKLIRTETNSAAVAVNEDVAATNNDTAFRWSASDRQWIFNIATKGLKGSQRYTYEVSLNDGTTFTFAFSLKA